MVIPKPNIKWKGNYEPVIGSLREAGLNVLEVQNFSEYELVRAYNNSKVFLYLTNPKVKEGFGYPPLEAMACSCAVISTSCCEYLVDGENCLIINNENDIDYIIRLVQQVLTNPEHCGIIKEGYKTAQQYDFNKTVDKFEEALQSGTDL